MKDHFLRILIATFLSLAVTGGCGPGEAAPAAGPTVTAAAAATSVPTAAPTASDTPTSVPTVAPSRAPTATSEPVAVVCPADVSQRIDLFTWWAASAAEVKAFDAMMQVFMVQCPGSRLANMALVPELRDRVRAELARRLQAGDPPDSWQTHAGQEGIGNYVPARQIAPLDDLFRETRFRFAVPAQLVDLISENGHPYSVPVNVHRSNVMWYNPKVLEAAGVTRVPSTYEEFFSACDQIKAAGRTCLALGPRWTAMHLLENVMLGTLGPARWSALWTGSGDWSSPEVTDALNTYARVLSYANPDHDRFPDWAPAAKLVIDNLAAFNIMGDWTYGYFANPAPDGLGRVPHTDFDWAPAPGTQGVFMFLADSFVMPANAKHPDASAAWLTVAASRAGQEAFNPLKGSICARTDCDPSLFGEYSQAAARDWARDTLAGSLVHGVVANDSWRGNIDTALGNYLKDPTRVAEFQTALVLACQFNGACR